MLLRQEYCTEHQTWKLVVNMCRGVANEEKGYLPDKLWKSKWAGFRWDTG